MSHRLPLLAALLLVSGCVRFQPAALYAGEAPAPVPERPRSLALAVEPVIYADAADDTIWFQDDARCTQGALTTSVVRSGERAVAVSWDRAAEGCQWAGFGVGWDGWAGKDLSEVLPHAAVEMYVRTREGRMYGLPIVLTLEDYAGGMGFAYTSNAYFERPAIDEQWQRVVVPLADFDLAAAGAKPLDPTNVKQLMFELQQAGSIYVDDIRLVWAEPRAQEPWISLPARPDATAFPITLFADAFINDDGWGLVTDACQSVDVAGGVLRLRWDTASDACGTFGTVGVSWDQWHPVDLTAVAGASAIRLRVRLPAGSAAELPVRVGLEDYGRAVSSAPLAARFADRPAFSSDWATVTIPFAALAGTADLSAVKQLLIRMDGAGEVHLDDIALVRTDR